MIETTPMMAQWQECKMEAKDAILFFRLGDFYEAFHEDASLVSRELGLTLTQRQNVPMCGVPFHAADSYIDKLIAKGHKVAIAEQMEDPKAAKGLLKRAVARIVTPGTLVQSQLLSDKKNNYIAAIAQIGCVFGLAFLDLTTGSFCSLELERISDLSDELFRLRPAEFLASKKFKLAHPQFFKELSLSFSFLVNEREEFNAESALKILLSHFQIASLDGFGLRGQTAAISAAGALLSYLKHDLNLRLDHITSMQSEPLSQFMAIDRSTLRNLELLESLSDGSSHHSLIDLLDHTSTPMGARLLRQWLKHPLLSLSQIEERQKAIADFLASPDKMKRLKSLLETVRDLERLNAKVVSRYASPRDLWTLGHSLSHVPAIRQELEGISAPLLQSDLSQLVDISPLARDICTSLVEHPPLRLSEGELFRDGVHPDLDHLRRLGKESLSWMARYQIQLREQTSIKTLKVGYTKAFGYYIEVSRAKGEQVPDEFQRRQTLVNAERFVTEELKRFEHQVLTAEERSQALEAELFEQLRAKTASQSSGISAIARALARIDALLSLAFAAREHRLIRPVVDNSDILEIKNGRHPVIERAIGSSHFIPNDTLLNADRQLLLLTGPNMAGKSTYIRQVALIVILAQIGSYIPADEARIGLIDKVFSRIGASDDLARGQSTFMVEMIETANILNNATSRSLVLLDEIGRGTSTYDGISIAWAVAEFLLTNPARKAKTLFATHYWELTRLEAEHKGALNAHVAVQETDSGIVFLRKIVPGGTDRSYGIHVGKLAGLPFAVIKRAEEMLLSLEENRRPKRKRTLSEEQFPLFQLPTPESPAVTELRSLDVDRLTPLQALQALADLKMKI